MFKKLFYILLTFLILLGCSDFTAGTLEPITIKKYGSIFGTADGENAKVIIRNKEIKVKYEIYNAKVPLKMGKNTIIVKYKFKNIEKETPVIITRITRRQFEKMKTKKEADVIVEEKQYSQYMNYRMKGLKLYYSVDKVKFTYVGKIVCYNEDYRLPGTNDQFFAIKIKYPSGRIEPKDRDYMMSSGQWFYDENDPAIKESIYIECP